MGGIIRKALPHMVLKSACACPEASVEISCGFVNGTFSQGRTASNGRARGHRPNENKLSHGSGRCKWQPISAHWLRST
jgi:hypothetical protein